MYKKLFHKKIFHTFTPARAKLQDEESSCSSPSVAESEDEEFPEFLFDETEQVSFELLTELLLPSLDSDPD